MKNLADVNVEETNELIENVLGELISKEILYEPFVCLKNKVILKYDIYSIKSLLRLKKKFRTATFPMKRVSPKSLKSSVRWTTTKKMPKNKKTKTG